MLSSRNLNSNPLLPFLFNNQDLRDIFLCPPILALRRIQNLGERLVRAKITSDTDLEPWPTICLRGKLALKYTLTKCPRH